MILLSFIIPINYNKLISLNSLFVHAKETLVFPVDMWSYKRTKVPPTRIYVKTAVEDPHPVAPNHHLLMF